MDVAVARWSACLAGLAGRVEVVLARDYGWRAGGVVVREVSPSRSVLSESGRSERLGPVGMVGNSRNFALIDLDGVVHRTANLDAGHLPHLRSVGGEHRAVVRSDQLKAVDFDLIVSPSQEDAKHLAGATAHKARNQSLPDNLRIEELGGGLMVTPADRVKEAEYDFNVLSLHFEPPSSVTCNAPARRSPGAAAEALKYGTTLATSARQTQQPRAAIRRPIARG